MLLETRTTLQRWNTINFPSHYKKVPQDELKLICGRLEWPQLSLINFESLAKSFRINYTHFTHTEKEMD